MFKDINPETARKIALSAVGWGTNHALIVLDEKGKEVVAIHLSAQTPQGGGEIRVNVVFPEGKIAQVANQHMEKISLRAAEVP